MPSSAPFTLRPRYATILLLAASLAAGCRPPTVSEWEAGCTNGVGPECTHPAGGERVDVLEPGHPFAVRVSSRGVLLVGEQHNRRLGLYALPSTAMTHAVEVGEVPTDVAFSPDGTRAYVTNQYSGTLGVIDVAARRQVATVSLPNDPYRVLVSLDGSRIYVTTAQGYLVTVESATLSQTELQLGGNLNGIAMNPSRGRLYLTSTSGILHELDLASGRPMRSVAIGGRPQEVVVSNEGGTLYVANESGPLHVIDAETLTRSSQLSAASGAFGLALSPDGAQLYATRPTANEVVVLERPTLAAVGRYLGGRPRRVTFDQTGATAIVGNESGWVTFIR